MMEGTMRHLFRVAGVVGAAFVAACATTHTVSQVGVVPAGRPMPYDGQPLAHGFRIEGRETTVVTHLEPNGNTSSGAYVAREYTGGALRVGHGNTDAGLEVDLGWVKGSEPVDSSLGPRPDADVVSTFLMSVRHSFELAPHVRLGTGFAFGFVDVPIALGGANTEHDGAAAVQLAVVPSYRSGPLVLFGGLDIVSEVDVPRTVVASDPFDTPEARAQGGSVVVSAGASVVFDSGLRLTAQLARPTGSDLAHQGLQLDLGVAFDFGQPPALHREPPHPPYYPPPAYPPPAGPPGAPPPAPVPAPAPTPGQPIAPY
jgi:hypothetical protein